MGEGWDECKSLLTIIQDAWNGIFTPDIVRKVLRQYQAIVSNPVEKRPDAKSKASIESKQVKLPETPPITLKDHQVEYIIRLSTSLNLNEVECLRLFYLASERAKRDAAMKQDLKRVVPSLVYEIYFNRRHNVLMAILDLVQMYESPPLPIGTAGDSEDLVWIINEYMQELIGDGFISNMIALLKELHTRGAADVQKHHETEIWRAVQILFAVFGRANMTSKMALELLDLLKTCSHQLLTDNDPFKTFICYMYEIIFMKALQAKFTAIETEYQSSASSSTRRGKEDTSLADFVQTVHDAAKSGWSNHQYRALFMLTWTLFLKRVKPFQPRLSLSDAQVQDIVMSQSLNTETAKTLVFVNLEKDFLQSYRLGLIGSDWLLLLCEVLAEFLNSSIQHHFAELEWLMTNEEKIDPSLLATSTNGSGASGSTATSTDELPKRNFSALLSIIAQTCEHAPRVVNMLWSNRQFTELLLTDLNEGGLATANGHGRPVAVAGASSSAGGNGAAGMAGLRGSAAVSLTSPLLPAYVQLLEALCRDARGCQQVFTMLRKSHLSWDTIFAAFKHILHKFLPPVREYDPYGRPLDHRNAAPPPKPATISTHEVSIVKCMLRLVKAVVRNEAVKQVIYTSSEFAVMDVLFALLGCRFPPSLKALVLQTIGAFAHQNAMIANIIWERLERSQILPTTMPAAERGGSGDPRHASRFGANGTTGGRFGGATAYDRHANGNGNDSESKGTGKNAALSGLWFDLEETEKASRAYPLTTSFMRLLLELLYAAPIPVLLGDGYRVPGILPYLQFVLRGVFIKLDDRQYADPSERWSMAECSLAIFCKLLEDFEPAHSDDVTNGGAVVSRNGEVQTSIGSELMRELLGESSLQAKLLQVLGNTARDILDPRDDGATAFVESSCLFALKLLYLTFGKEELFLQKLRMTKPSARASALSDVLGKRPDEVIAVARVIGHAQIFTQTPVQILVRAYSRAGDTRTDDGYGGVAPTASTNGDDAMDEDVDQTELAFYAASVFHTLSHHDGPLILNMFEKAGESAAVCSAFAEQLQHAQPTIEPPSDEKTLEWSPQALAAARAAADLGSRRSRVVIVILEILLSNLGVPDKNLTHLLLGFEVSGRPEHSDLNASTRKHCLDTLLLLVRKPRFALQFPALAESCFQLFYKLCSNQTTSRPFLSFLQHYDMFFFSLLDNLPVTIPRHNATPFLLQRQWLLKCIALELHVTVSRHEHWSDYVEAALLKLGFSQAAEEKSSLGHINGSGAPNGNNSDGSDGYEGVEQRRSRLLELLDVIRVPVPPNPEPIPPAIGGLRTADCKVYESPQSYQYNVRSLYILASRSLDPAGAAAVCRAALQWNHINTLLAACKGAFDGWKQMVEVALYECFDPQHEPIERYEQVLFDLLTGLLTKLTSDDRVWMVLGDAVSGVALTVMAKLREQVLSASGQRLTQSHNILQLTVQAIINNRHHLARAHLYGVFLNYMQYTRKLQTPTGLFADGGASRDGRRLMDIAEQHRHLESRNLALLESMGGRILHLVVQDAADGDARLRSMAFAFLTSLLANDNNGSASPLYWLSSLRSRGSIAHFLAQLKTRDALLRDAITDRQLRHYDQILNYESLMSFLIKLCETKEGTESLLDYDTVATLSSCKFIDQRPISSEAATTSIGGLPSPMARHYQILLPILRLLVAMHSAAATNLPLHRHTLDFIKAHNDVITSVLSQQVRSLSALRALQLTVTLFYFLYHGPLYATDAERRRDIDRYEPVLTSLLARYAAGNTRARSRHGRGQAMLALMERSDGKRALTDESRTNGGRNGVHGRDAHNDSYDHQNGNSIINGTDEHASEWEVDGAEDLITELCRALLAICVTKLAVARRLSSSSTAGGVNAKRGTDTAARLLGTAAATSPVLFAPLLDDVDDKLSSDEAHLGVLVSLLKRQVDQNTGRAPLLVTNEAVLQDAIDNINTRSLTEITSQCLTISYRLDLPESCAASHRKSIAYHKLLQWIERLRADKNASFFIIQTSLQLLFHHVVLYLDGRRRDTDRAFDSDMFKKDCKGHIAPLLQSITVLLDRAERPLSHVLATGNRASSGISSSRVITASSLVTSGDDEILSSSSSRRDHAPHVFLRHIVRKFETLIL